MIKNSKKLLLLGMIIFASQANCMEESEFESFFQDEKLFQPEPLLKIAAIASFNTLLSKPLDVIHKELKTLPYEIKEGPLAQTASKVREEKTGNTYLHLANTSEEIEKYLALGANHQAKNLFGQIPLITLLLSKKIKIVNKLIELNNNCNDKDYFGFRLRTLTKFCNDDTKELAKQSIVVSFFSSLFNNQKKLTQKEEIGTEKSLIEVLQTFLSIKEAKKAHAFRMLNFHTLQQAAQMPLNALGETALHLAQTSSEIEKLIILEANPNKLSNLQETPLHTLIRNGHSKAAVTLLENAEKIDLNIRNSKGLSCLDYAILLKDLDLIKTLYDMGAQIIRTKTDNTRKILKTLELAIKSSKSIQILDIFADTIDHLKNKYRAWVIVYAAARKETVPIISKLLPKGQTINFHAEKTGYTPLILAVLTCGNSIIFDIIENLKSFGADFSMPDKKGRTVLMHAAEVNGEIIPLCIKEGCPVNAQDYNGNTAIMYAVNNNNIIAFYHLINANTDVNIANDSGVTPLMLAAHNKKLFGFISGLIIMGANQDAQDIYGKKAENYCPEVYSYDYELKIAKALKKRERIEKEKARIEAELEKGKK